MSGSSLIVVMILAALAQVGDADRYDGQTTADPVINEAVIRVADDLKLPAEEPGVLVHLAVEEGSLIRAGQKLGQIDDREPQMQKKAAQAGYAAAYKRWKDDIEIQFATAAAAVAQADYEMMEETNRQAQKTITDVEMRQKKLEWDKMNLSIKKAIHEQEIAQYEARTKMTEVEAADLAIKRRVITAPFDGVVERRYRKQNEWVNIGDPILYVLRLDTLEVSGGVDPNQYDPHELQGCDVTVKVKLARGREETVRGRIKNVSFVVGEDGLYEVRAEIANRQENGNWVLRDGYFATMTVHLGTGGTAGVSQAP
jgi:HlyD family secretion protein